MTITYTKHALARMAERGISQQDAGGKTLFQEISKF
jgi:hypothetical protein